MASVPTNLRDELVEAGFDSKQAAVIARAVAAAAVSHSAVPQPAPNWPVPVIAAVLVATIGIVGAGVYKNGDRIDAVETRLSTDIANVSERLARIETLLAERLPERR